MEINTKWHSVWVLFFTVFTKVQWDQTNGNLGFPSHPFVTKQCLLVNFLLCSPQHCIFRECSPLYCFERQLSQEFQTELFVILIFSIFIANQMTSRQENKCSKRNNQGLQPKLESKSFSSMVPSTHSGGGRSPPTTINELLG